MDSRFIINTSNPSNTADRRLTPNPPVLDTLLCVLLRARIYACSLAPDSFPCLLLGAVSVPRKPLPCGHQAPSSLQPWKCEVTEATRAACQTSKTVTSGRFPSALGTVRMNHVKRHVPVSFSHRGSLDTHSSESLLLKTL